MLHKGYTKFIMPAGIMSPARITYIGLTGYLMIHPVINRINPNPVKFRMDDRISGLIGFGAHLYSQEIFQMLSGIYIVQFANVHRGEFEFHQVRSSAYYHMDSTLSYLPSPDIF